MANISASGIFHYYPLISSPAITSLREGNTAHEIRWITDRRLIWIRTISAFAVDAIALGVLLWRYPAALPAVFATRHFTVGIMACAGIGGSISGMIAWFSETSRARMAIDQRAVTEYLEKPQPSPAATERLRSNLDAVRRLVQGLSEEQRLDVLNKRNTQGEHLLDGLTMDENVPMIVLLLKSGADPLCARCSPSLKARIVEIYAADPHPSRRLERALQRKWVTAKEISKETQVKIWLSSVNGEKATEHLSQYGFNPNVCDATGQTALMHIAQRPAKNGAAKRRTIFKEVTWLLQAGASPFLKNREGKTSLDLASWPGLKMSMEGFANLIREITEENLDFHGITHIN